MPASPVAELTAIRGRADTIAPGSLLTGELATFMESGISVIAASVGLDRRPIAAMCLACRVEPSGQVRLILRAAANAALLDALAAGHAVAATFTRPHDHRSIQLKASAAVLGPLASGDLAVIETQCIGMRQELLDAAYVEGFASGYVAYGSEELTAIEFLPEQAFVQTPGAGAGTRLEA